MAETEPLTDADRAWLETQIPESGPDKILYAQWIIKKKRNKIDKRIIVITSLRVRTVKKNVFGSYLFRRTGSLLDLTEVSSQNDSEVFLRFDDWFAEVHGENVDNLIFILLEAYTKVAFGLPELERVKIDIKPDSRRPDLTKIETPLLGGFIEMYKAACFKFGVTLDNTEKQFIKHIIAQATEYANTSRDGILDLSQAPGLDPNTGYSKIDLTPINYSAMYNPYIHTLMIRDVKIPKIFREFCELLAKNTTLKTIILSNLDASANADALSNAFDNSNPSLSSLVYLDLSRNKIKNSGASSISKALRAFRQLQTLKLDNCGIGDSGYDEILNAIHSNPHSRPVLKTLNLSYNNKFGERGTKAMNEWLLDNRGSEDFALECLLLTNTGINSAVVMRALRGSPKLSTVDLSGNPINSVDIPDIIKTLKETTVLTDFRICKTGLKSKLMATLIEPYLRNTGLGHNVLFSACHHDWGQKNSQRFVIPSIAKSVNLQGLFLNKVGLGNQGIIDLCKALQGIPTLQALDISNNFVRNKKITAAAGAVAELIKNHQSLLCFRARGTHKYHLGTDTSVVLKAVPDSKTLNEIDISGNRATDNSITTLGWAISRTSTLQALRFDKNEMSLSGFQDLVNNIKQNSSLFDVAMPELDLKLIVDNTKEKQHRYRNDQKLNELKRQLIDHLKGNRAGRGRPTFLFDPFYDSPYDDNYPIPSAWEMAHGVGNSYYNKGARTSSMYDGKVTAFATEDGADSALLSPRSSATRQTTAGNPPPIKSPPPTATSTTSPSSPAPPPVAAPPALSGPPHPFIQHEDDLNLDDINVEGLEFDEPPPPAGPPPISSSPQEDYEEEVYYEEVPPEGEGDFVDEVYYEEEVAPPEDEFSPPMGAPDEEYFDDDELPPPGEDFAPMPPPPPM